MKSPAPESAHLFTPGRASYVTTTPDGSFKLHLTQASKNRGLKAAEAFDGDRHTVALFAGGYPGVAQNWPVEHIPEPGNKEADLMAAYLEERLLADGYSPDEIAHIVKVQSESNNSIGDVLESMRQGLLDPNIFHDNAHPHAIDLVAGGLHAARFRMILSKGLDLDPNTIKRIAVTDAYGTPATEFRPRELAPVAVAKELAAIALTRRVLANVRPGIEGLDKAEQEFNDTYAKLTAHLPKS